MDQKFYLNKIVKIDNIENYTLDCILKLRESYDNFLESTEGADPDYPMINLLGNGKQIKGTNAYSVFDDESDIKSIFHED